MMAWSTNAPFKGRTQKRKNNHLQIITFGLQRTAGPYSGVKTQTSSWGPHVRFRRVQTLVRENSPLVKPRNSA